MNGFIQLPDSIDPARIWFTSDHHFGHANIIRFTNRPYANVLEMDRALIWGWNQTVGLHDHVFHLGDFHLGENAHDYFKFLRGRIRILGTPWHHDRRWLANAGEVLAAYWPVEILPSQVVLEVPQLAVKGRPLVIHLNHYPMDSWDRSHHGAWHLYGHVHNMQYSGAHYKTNVGVDVCSFKPINLLAIKEIMENRGWPQSPLEKISEAKTA